MTYKGHVEKGKVVFDGPASLPDGTRVRIEVELAEPEKDTNSDLGPSLAEVLSPVIGKAEGLPEDWSEQHDRYLREEYRR